MVMYLLALVGCTRKKVIDSFPDSFVGVGLELTLKNREPVVVRTIEGGPADLAGVTKGDRITSVDGHVTQGLTLGDVVVKLRGKPNSQVTLGVVRKEQKILVVVRRTRLTKADQKDYKAHRQ